MLQSFTPTPQISHKSFKLKTARLFQLTPTLSEDEVDRLPSTIRVGWYDIMSYIFSMCTYVFDMALDIWVAIEHFKHERFVAFSFTILFVAIPSLLINLISFLFYLDDQNDETQQKSQDFNDKFLRVEKFQKFPMMSKKPSKGIEMTDNEELKIENQKSNKMLRWIAMSVLQIAPLIWHCRALKSAYTCMQIQKLPRRERLLYFRFYYKMIEADRDASVLRFFEALLESLPQLLIQGYFLLDDLMKATSDGVAFDWKLRVFAMIVSLLSISFSFVSHHRTLRICLPDKQNLNITECNLILTWRFLSIASRFIFLSLFLYFQPNVALILLFIHLLLSTLHIAIHQRLETNSKFDCLDKLMIAINVWIHVFAPFNMSAGRTRERYGIGYLMEVVELVLIFICLNFFSSQPNSKQFLDQSYVFIWSSAAYFIGLIVMIIYFSCAHPSLNYVNDDEVRKTSFKTSIINEEVK